MSVTIAHGVISFHALSVRGTKQFHKLVLTAVLAGAYFLGFWGVGNGAEKVQGNQEMKVTYYNIISLN